MSDYKITMDYKSFQRLIAKEKELKELKNELANCYQYNVPKETPIIVNIRELKKIALRYVPVPIEDNEVFVDG